MEHTCYICHTHTWEPITPICSVVNSPSCSLSTVPVALRACAVCLSILPTSAAPSAECASLCRLRKLLVLWEGHVSSSVIRAVTWKAKAIGSYRLSSIRMVSMVKSRFHWTRHGSLVGSTLRALSCLSHLDTAYSLTLPVLPSTQGRLIFDKNVTSGGISGYCEPQWIFKL